MNTVDSIRMRVHTGDRQRRNHGIESESSRRYPFPHDKFRSVIDLKKVYISSLANGSTYELDSVKRERETIIATGCKLIIQFEIFHENRAIYGAALGDFFQRDCEDKRRSRWKMSFGQNFLSSFEEIDSRRSTPHALFV